MSGFGYSLRGVPDLVSKAEMANDVDVTLPYVAGAENILEFRNVIPANDGAQLQLLASNDDLVSFENVELIVSNGANTYYKGNPYLELAGSVGNAATELGVSGQLIFTQPDGQTVDVWGYLRFAKNDGSQGMSIITAQVVTTTLLTNLRAQFGSGLIESGLIVHLTRSF